MSLEHPLGSLHEFEREFTESWTTRWFRMTGNRPQMSEGKRATTAVSIRFNTKPRTKKVKCNPGGNRASLQHGTNWARSRAQIPDRLPHLNGLEI